MDFEVKAMPGQEMSSEEILRQLEFLKAHADAADYTELMEVEDKCKNIY